MNDTIQDYIVFGIGMVFIFSVPLLFSTAIWGEPSYKQDKSYQQCIK